MNLNFMRLTAYLSIVGVLFVPGHQIVAQEQVQDSASAGTLEEVIVTARRREESLMLTPVSITAFSAAELESRQIERSHQIAEATPNLVYRNITNSSNVGGSIFIRGIGQSDWVPTVQPGVGVYADGAYVARINASLAEIVDIESIQVLRGPQGTLFGRNTIGGAILINTVKPSEAFDGYVDLKLGEFDLRQAKASVNVPFTSNFFGKFSVLLRDQDGYIDTPNIPEAGKFPGNETKAFRAALRFLTERVTVDWATDYFEHESDGPPMVVQAIFEEVPGSNAWLYNNITAPTLGLPLVDDSYALGRESFTNLGSEWLERQNADVFNTTLSVQWDINSNLAFKSITNYRDMESNEFRDGDGTPFPIISFYNPVESEQLSQEFSLSGTSLSDRLDWLVGLYYFEEDSGNVSDVNFPLFHIASGATVENSSTAVFGQFTYDLTDRASVTLGARWSDEKLDSIVDDTNQHLTAFLCRPTGSPPFCPPGFAGFLDIPAPPAPGSIRIMPNGLFEIDESRTDPFVNLAYEFTDGLMGYVSYSEGFKGGGFVQRVTPGNTVTSFGPETAKVMEVGAKWSSLNNRVRATGALFSTDYKDLQVPVTTSSGVSIQNAGDADLKGGELEVAASAGERWEFSFGIGYLDGEYKNFSPNVQFSSDNRLPSVMDWQTNASIVYSLPFASGNIVARLDHNYLDDYFAYAQNVPGTLVPSRSVFNTSITYRPDSENWELAIEGRNITDELVIEEVFGDIAANGFIMPVIGPPSAWAVRFRYRFQ